MDRVPLEQASDDKLVCHAIAVIRALRSDACLVGGYVRDLLLGRSGSDLDVIVPDGGIQLARAIARELRGHSFVLDETRDVGRAIVEDDSGRRLEIDVARMRDPVLVRDLALRDFTVNAIALDLSRDEDRPSIIDPFEGRADLGRSLLRAVSQEAFVDDPLRLLRGVRLSTELGFAIEEETAQLMQRDAGLLADVAGERVRDELIRIFLADAGWRQLDLLHTMGLLGTVLPEAAALIGLDETPPHGQDMFDHTCSVMAHLQMLLDLLWPAACGGRTVERRPARFPLAGAPVWQRVWRILEPFGPRLRTHLNLPLASERRRRDWLSWAALAHDWGEAVSWGEAVEGRASWSTPRDAVHAVAGARLADKRLCRLRLAGAEIDYVCALVAGHMRPARLLSDGPLSRGAAFRYYRDLGMVGVDCALLSLAHFLSLHAAETGMDWLDEQLDTTSWLLSAFFDHHDTWVEPTPLLNGREVIALAPVPAGPRVGCLLAQLIELQAQGQVTTREQAVRWLGQQSDGGAAGC